MRNEIKEIKKEALEKLGEQENPEPWFSPKEVLDIIAEIEFLETEIKQLKQDRQIHTKIISDKSNDQIEYGKQDRMKIEKLEKRNEETELQRHRCSQVLDRANEKINKLQAVRECAKSFEKKFKDITDIAPFTTKGYLELWLTELQQAIKESEK